MNLLTAAARAVVIIDLCLTIFIVYVLGPTSVAAVLFIGLWLTFPHWLMLWLIRGKRDINARQLVAVPYLSMAISIGGVAYIGYILAGPPDAQNAIGICLTPIYQLAATALGLPLAFAAERDMEK